MPLCASVQGCADAFLLIKGYLHEYRGIFLNCMGAKITESSLIFYSVASSVRHTRYL